ncbi:hypothetical protein CEUSTIGMA_g1411.t1 [Chlamydomonas eustigma]|uniref:Methyltransferase n=1 Tax=Chlamydomonas eustigma TaxID=1157962 RepID=A0A250WT34_9CHLO|nr:hypothetical protein CEUSTIGMA_g1411.t1 [Chlamydomonas eustigma]|eukprot:GAX73961.1 hypothetical protein CEUSTIGMA_g1411.t1 [Chlamydomonas eustigma]
MKNVNISMVSVQLACIFLICISSVLGSKILQISNVSICGDVDELPAFQAEEKWATLFEVIAPYRALCRVQAPESYQERPAWPKCLWELPKGNMPKATLWETGHIKSSQSWLKISGDKIQLPRAGGSLAASKFLEILPDSIKMETIQTVLDEGAGVCGMAAEIMVTFKHRPLVLSYAPHDSHANQVQVCMERGVPAIIFNMARYQFPVPPGSFDMVTCKWCWHWIAAVSMGQWFLEVDRVIRPGGYFVIYASVWQTLNFKEQFEFWMSSLGWLKLEGVKHKDMAAYQKPLLALAAATNFTSCPPAESQQPSFRRFHVPCRSPAPGVTAPDLLKPGQSPDVMYVKALLAMMPSSAMFTNVMDANADSGTFGEAIRDLLPNAWTLNIQPVKAAEFHHKEQGGGSLNFAGLSNYVQSLGPDGLPGIFAAGRFGLYHDWCYMFPIYPRGFDLIHVRGLILAHENCLQQAVLELDRLLRPGGHIVLSGAGVAESVTEDAVASLRWMKVPSLSGEDPDGGQGAAMVMRKMGGVFNTL